MECICMKWDVDLERLIIIASGMTLCRMMMMGDASMSGQILQHPS